MASSHGAQARVLDMLCLGQEPEGSSGCTYKHCLDVAARGADPKSTGVVEDPVLLAPGSGSPLGRDTRPEKRCQIPAGKVVSRIFLRASFLTARQFPAT